MNIEKFTQNAQQAVMDAQNLAIVEGNPTIDGEHIHEAQRGRAASFDAKYAAYAEKYLN